MLYQTYSSGSTVSCEAGEPHRPALPALHTDTGPAHIGIVDVTMIGSFVWACSEKMRKAVCRNRSAAGDLGAQHCQHSAAMLVWTRTAFVGLVFASLVAAKIQQNVGMYMRFQPDRTGGTQHQRTWGASGVQRRQQGGALLLCPRTGCVRTVLMCLLASRHAHAPLSFRDWWCAGLAASARAEGPGRAVS